MSINTLLPPPAFADNQIPLRRLSVVGIDGAGKSSITRHAQVEISNVEADFSSLEIDRELHVIRDGMAQTVSYDRFERAAGKIDGPSGNLVTRALYAITKGRISNRPALATSENVNTVINVRDPIIDSYVFAREKLPIPSPKFALRSLRLACQFAWPDTVVWIDTDPECALHRISQDASQRTQYGEQSHENIDTLRAMQYGYASALMALGDIAPTQVIHIDGNRSAAAVSGDVQQILADTFSR